MSDFNIPDVFPLLRRGEGENPEMGGCLVQVAGYLNDGVSWTDATPCVHPVLRTMAIWVNDLIGDEYRNSLLEFVPRLIGTGVPNDVSQRSLLEQRDALTLAMLAGADWEIKRAIDFVDQYYLYVNPSDELIHRFNSLGKNSPYTEGYLAENAILCKTLLKSALDAYDEFTGRTEPAPIPAEKWDDLLKAMSV